MDHCGFADIRQFRVLLPQPLYPFKGRESIQARTSAEQSDAKQWIGIDELYEFFPALFSDRNPLNIPGPIYGAETDTCETGPQQAPNNVALDKNGQEFVFKQASTAVEFRDLVSAAMCECFQGYGADGDEYWRLSLIREWWRSRHDMQSEVGHKWSRPEVVERWMHALRGGTAGYLRVYAFFVENGRSPIDGDALPDID